MTRPPATEETPCNLCGASDYEVVGTADRDRKPLRTVMCRNCGLVWTNPRPPAAEMDRYYETEYRADYKGLAAPPLRKIVRGMRGAHARRQALRPLLGPPPPPRGATGAPLKLIDVGCGAGEFVYLLRREHVEASGIEPGRDYAGFAREVLRIPIQTATVDTAAVSPASHDVVTMFHCLEHVPDPRRVLSTVRGWLKKGGLVVVEVPNVESTVQAPSHRYHYAHLYQFTSATLSALGAASGLHPVRTYYSDDGGNVTCVFRRGEGRDAGRMPVEVPALREAAARTRAVLRSHTALRHYLSPTPYRRALSRLRRRWREGRLLRRLKTVDDVLRWATESL